MIISEKQIMQLMRMARRYGSVCAQMSWKDDHKELKELIHEIENQQSEELKVVE